MPQLHHHPVSPSDLSQSSASGSVSGNSGPARGGLGDGTGLGLADVGVAAPARACRPLGADQADLATGAAIDTPDFKSPNPPNCRFCVAAATEADKRGLGIRLSTRRRICTLRFGSASTNSVANR